jgi:hypothetical protein
LEKKPAGVFLSDSHDPCLTSASPGLHLLGVLEEKQNVCSLSSTTKEKKRLMELRCAVEFKGWADST